MSLYTEILFVMPVSVVQSSVWQDNLLLSIKDATAEIACEDCGDEEDYCRSLICHIRRWLSGNRPQAGSTFKDRFCFSTSINHFDLEDKEIDRIATFVKHAVLRGVMDKWTNAFLMLDPETNENGSDIYYFHAESERPTYEFTGVRVRRMHVPFGWMGDPEWMAEQTADGQRQPQWREVV